MLVYVETGAGAYRDGAAVAWPFDLPHWGLAGQGHDEASALAALEVATGEPVDTFTVAERIHGNELAFDRDHAPARPAELALTRCLLDAARAETIRLVASASVAELDWDDPHRRLPAWATWRTPRQLAWHIADVESRYYLAALGVPPPPRAADLVAELHAVGRARAGHAERAGARPVRRPDSRRVDDRQGAAPPGLARDRRAGRAPSATYPRPVRRQSTRGGSAASGYTPP